MELLSQFRLNPYRIYTASKKINKGIAVFPTKSASSYLDYSINFEKKLEDGERLLTGNVTVNSNDILISSVVCNGSYMTAFISGGKEHSSYYLTFEAQTNLGGSFIQDMILSVTGKGTGSERLYQYLTFTEHIAPPLIKPPLNAIRINDRYLISDSGFFMVI